eukprot:355666-Chlamydomonas_euryale.AAC.1
MQHTAAPCTFCEWWREKARLGTPCTGHQSDRAQQAKAQAPRPHSPPPLTASYSAQQAKAQAPRPHPPLTTSHLAQQAKATLLTQPTQPRRGGPHAPHLQRGPPAARPAHPPGAPVSRLRAVPPPSMTPAPPAHGAARQPRGASDQLYCVEGRIQALNRCCHTLHSSCTTPLAAVPFRSPPLLTRLLPPPPPSPRPLPLLLSLPLPCPAGLHTFRRA